MIHLLILNADIIQNSELLKKNLRGCDPHLCYWIACDAGVSCLIIFIISSPASSFHVCMLNMYLEPAAGLAYLSTKTGNRGKTLSLVYFLESCCVVVW